MAEKKGLCECICAKVENKKPDVEALIECMVERYKGRTYREVWAEWTPIRDKITEQALFAKVTR